MKDEHMDHDPREAGAGHAQEPAIVTVKNLTIYRGREDSEQFVVHIPELIIPSGKFVAIVGQSGCGKSSLLTVLGLMRGSPKDLDCRIECDELSFNYRGDHYSVYKNLAEDGSGHCIDRTRLERLRQKAIGFCLQGGELISTLSLKENVAITGFLDRRAAPLQSAETYLERLQLEHLLGSFPDRLSGGQHQRGVVARALAHTPDLIILDEPTSALDRLTARETLKLLKECANQGQTVLMVTHDPILAKEFADIVVEMDNMGKGKGGIRRIRRTDGSGNEAASPAPGEKGEASGAAAPASERASRELSQWRESYRYYLRLGLMDALGPLYQMRRLLDFINLKRNSTFAAQVAMNSVVLVAIGLLILILMGMRSGLVEQFRQNLTQSPTGRQLILTPKARKHGLVMEELKALKTRHPELDLVIPVTKDVVSLEEKTTRQNAVTLYGTVPEDPMLNMVYSDMDFSTLDVDAVILSKTIAREKKLAVGDAVTLWIQRVLDAEGKDIESSPATLKLTHVIDTDVAGSAFVHLDFSRQISDYKRGRPVPERGWPGTIRPITPQYSAFLLASKGPLSAREHNALELRGLVARPVEPGTRERLLYGWLKSPETLQEEKRPEPQLWRVQSGRQEGDYKWLNPNIADVEGQLTDSDGILLPWSEPLPAELNGNPVLLVGLSGRLRWLRGCIAPGHGFFSSRKEGWIGTFDNLKTEKSDGALRIPIQDRSLELPFVIHGEKESAEEADTKKAGASPAEATPRVMATPASFLARLHMMADGAAEPNIDRRIFQNVKEEEEYYQIRAYVDDVYQVTRLHEELSGEFGVQSNASRVTEMKKYAGMLDIIVNVISTFALIIAIFTAFLVFREIGESKKRMLATLRIMGLTTRGVHVLMFVRGMLVAGIASAFLVALGFAGATVLNTTYTAGACLLTFRDFFYVISGVVATCVIGVLVTSRGLAKADPVAAFEEANKFV